MWLQLVVPQFTYIEVSWNAGTPQVSMGFNAKSWSSMTTGWFGVPLCPTLGNPWNPPYPCPKIAICQWENRESRSDFDGFNGWSVQIATRRSHFEAIHGYTPFIPIFRHPYAIWYAIWYDKFVMSCAAAVQVRTRHGAPCVVRSVNRPWVERCGGWEVTFFTSSHLVTRWVWGLIIPVIYGYI